MERPASVAIFGARYQHIPYCTTINEIDRMKQLISHKNILSINLLENWVKNIQLKSAQTPDSDFACVLHFFFG